MGSVWRTVGDEDEDRKRGSACPTWAMMFVAGLEKLRVMDRSMVPRYASQNTIASAPSQAAQQTGGASRCGPQATCGSEVQGRSRSGSRSREAGRAANRGVVAGDGRGNAAGKQSRAFAQQHETAQRTWQVRGIPPNDPAQARVDQSVLVPYSNLTHNSRAKTSSRTGPQHTVAAHHITLLNSPGTQARLLGAEQGRNTGMQGMQKPGEAGWWAGCCRLHVQVACVCART